MKLPKMYAPVKVKFWSLRGALGASGGFMEVDREVIRTARRVVGRYGEWEWQIVFNPHELMHESRGVIENDMECIKSDRDEVEVIQNKGL